MKFLNRYVYVLMFFYCGCLEATSKGTSQSFTCPQTLNEKEVLQADWVTVGRVPAEKFPLRTIGIIYPDLSDVNNRQFSEDMIDEWDDLKDKSQAIAEYDENHEKIMMKCVYAKSAAEDSDRNLKNVVLLIPLPSKKPVNCLLTRRDIDPTHEISCKVK